MDKNMLLLPYRNKEEHCSFFEQYIFKLKKIVKGMTAREKVPRSAEDSKRPPRKLRNSNDPAVGFSTSAVTSYMATASTRLSLQGHWKLMLVCS